MGRTVISSKDVAWFYEELKPCVGELKREIKVEIPEEIPKQDRLTEVRADREQDVKEWKERFSGLGGGDVPFTRDRLEEMIRQQIPPTPDTYTSRLIKYIPAEVIALYLTLDTLIRSKGELHLAMYWGVFLFGIVATYLYLWRVQKVNKQLQLLISVIAYCVWVFAIGGPFVHLSWYDPLYAGLLLPSYTFLISIVEA